MSAKKTSSGFAPAEGIPVRWQPGVWLFAVTGLVLSFLLTGYPVAFAEQATATPATAPAAVQPLQPVPVDPNIMQARVSYQGGAGMIRGKADSDWSYATVNAVVAPGDSLWVDKQGTLEIEIAQGSYLRLADGSKAEVVSFTPSIDIRGVVGSFFVQRMKHSVGDMMVETPVGRIRVGPNSDVRLDILGNGSTTVSTRWGQAVIQPQGGGDVTVAQGQRSYVDPGYLPSLPAAFDKSAEDSFDTWNRERARLIVAAYEKLPATSEIPPATVGTSDLGAYGQWVNYNGQQYWHPDVEGYVPYRDGYWDYVPDSGYCWVDDYPFGYTTCHYGRWLYDPDEFGWLWGWEPGWGLGWCATLTCGPNFLWCPLDPWNRPCWGFGGPSFWLGGYQFGFGACSYCGIDGLRFGRCGVQPFGRGLFNQYRNNFGVFGINGRGGHFLNFGNNALGVHNFPPNSTFRGRATLAGFNGTAGGRVATLEHGQPRSGGVNGVTHAGMRTPIASSGVRTAQVSPSILSHTQQAVNRQMSAPRQAMARGGLGGGTAHGAANINASRGTMASRAATLNNRSIAQATQQHVNVPGTTHVRPAAASSPSGRFPMASMASSRASNATRGPSSSYYRSAPAPAYRSAPSGGRSYSSGGAWAGGGYRGGGGFNSGGGGGYHSGGGMSGGGGGFHSGGGWSGGGGGFHSGGGVSGGGGGFHSGGGWSGGGGGSHSGGGWSGGGGGGHGGGGWGGGGGGGHGGGGGGHR